MSLGKYFVKTISRRVKKKEESMDSRRVGRQSTYRNKRNCSIIFFKIPCSKNIWKENLLKILLTACKETCSLKLSCSKMLYTVFWTPRPTKMWPFSFLHGFLIWILAYTGPAICLLWKCHSWKHHIELHHISTGSPVWSNDSTYAVNLWHVGPSTPLVIWLLQ